MDGYVTIGTKLDTNGINSGLNIMSREINSKTDAMAKGIQKTFNLLKGSIIGAGILWVTHKITGELSNAISRVDTLNNYTKVMGNLGISSKDAEQSIDLLSDKLIGLPTTLDDAAAAVQRFTSANSNVKASTEMFLALNNAILAGGAPAQLQATALEQLSQAYTKGKPDMMEWRTAMSAMPAQLKQIALAMGYVNADALGEALRSGKVSMNDFMLTITKLNKEGVQGFQSFEEQARNSTGGIQTSIINVKTALTRGIAEIMNAIGQSNIAGFFQGIAKAINFVIPYIVAFIKLMKTAVNSIAGFFGKKAKKQADDTSNAVANLGSSASDTASDIDNAADSTKKLNKELKQTASFDEMNILNDKQSSGGSGSGSGGGAGALGDFDLSAFDEAEEKESKADKILKDMKKHLKEFARYLNNLGFDELLGHVENIGKSVRKIFDNAEVKEAANKFVNTANFAFRVISENALRVGINIGNLLLGSIDKYLSKNIPRISKFFVEMFDIGSVRTMLYARISQIIEELSEAFTGDAAQQIGSNIIAMFANPLMSVTEILGKFGNDVLNAYITPVEENMGILRRSIEDTLRPIQKQSETISEAFTYIGDSLTDLYDNTFHPIMVKIRELWANTFGELLKVYDYYFAPVVDEIANKLKKLWDEHLKPLWDQIVLFVGDISKLWMAFYENVLLPIINWIIQNVLPKLAPVIKGLSTILINEVGRMADKITTFIQILRGFINFLTGVFTGDWKKAWNGIKSIFKAIVDSLPNVFKAPLNRVIDQFNKFTSGIGKIKIPDWVPGYGGQSFKIAKIPRLAKGTILNAPGKGVPVAGGRAIAGEAGREAYLPLSDTQLLEELGSVIGKYITINATITNTMNGRIISRELQKINNESDFAFNR